MVCTDERSQVFHVISRVVDRNVIFEEEEKGVFLANMRSLEAFSGVEILSYCLMGNHFHILLHVPKRPETISDAEVKERMVHLYGKRRMEEIKAEIAERNATGDTQFEKDFYEKLRKRMYNLSNFVRDLKWRFSIWYNKKTGRKGTLYEDRFRSVLVEPSEDAMMRVAAYIELNSVRAGLVSQPHEYRWCSFTEAMAGGSKAKAGITKIACGLDGKSNWEKVSRIYRSYFLHKAAEQNHSRKGIDSDEYHESMKSGGDLSENEKLRIRCRFFTEGVVLGSKEFLKEFYARNKEVLESFRKREGYKVIKGKDPLFSYRKVE